MNHQPETLRSFKFRVRVFDELEGCVKSPKDRDETLEILRRELQMSYGDGHEVLEFTEISDEEFESYRAAVEHMPETPTLQ